MEDKIRTESIGKLDPCHHGNKLVTESRVPNSGVLPFSRVCVGFDLDPEWEMPVRLCKIQSLLSVIPCSIFSSFLSLSTSCSSCSVHGVLCVEVPFLVVGGGDRV